MKLTELFKSKKRTLSFEFFPPKNPEQETQLFEALNKLREFSPDFVSVTYGAMGQTRERTFSLVQEIKHKFSVEPVVHLTCVADTKEQLKAKLEELEQKGMKNILALRGDPPQEGGEAAFPPGGFKYAGELVSFIKQEHPDFCLGVAGYPEGHKEAPNLDEDIKHIKEKVEAGAEYIITQLFFDNKFYFDFAEKCRKAGIKVPIIPGIMVITGLKQIKMFTEMCGASIPKALKAKLDGQDQEAVLKIGTEWALEQCRGLLKANVPGLHFFVLNKAEPVAGIISRLR